MSTPRLVGGKEFFQVVQQIEEDLELIRNCLEAVLIGGDVLSRAKAGTEIGFAIARIFQALSELKQIGYQAKISRKTE